MTKGEGVKNLKKFSDIICGSPLNKMFPWNTSTFAIFYLQEDPSHNNLFFIFPLWLDQVLHKEKVKLHEIL